MNWGLDLLALATASIAQFFNLRLKNTYFLDSKFFLTLANTGFIFVILQALIARMISSPPSMVLFILLNSLMATSIGFASFLLERSGGGTGLRELTNFLSGPPKAFTLYLGIVISWTIASIILEPFQLQQTIGPEGPMFYYTYDSWWLAYTAVLLISFFAGPVYRLYQQSLRVKDSKVVRSMRMLVFSWTGFGIVEFVQGTAGAYSLLAQDMGALVSGLLFIVISLALKEPTLLGRIISSEEAVSQAVYTPDADTVVVYKTDSDRKRLLENLVAGSQEKKWDMVFFVPRTDIRLYTSIITGASSKDAFRKRKLGVEPLEILLKGAKEDSEAIHFGMSGRLRELIDIGEVDGVAAHQIVQRASSHNNLHKTSRVGRIWALKAGDRSPDLVDEIRRSSPKARVIDLAGHQETFSKLLGLEHAELLGKRVLLEYDPSSNFEEVVLKFAVEFQANVEPVSVFTSPGSPLYRKAKEQRNIRLFTSSTQTSTPVKVSDEEVLIPDRDISLLLDAVDKFLVAHHGRSVGIAMDLITDLIISQGFDKTYGVLSAISEMTEVEKATLLLLVNYVALDERALNGLRGLFRFHLRYDAEGLKKVRVPDSEQQRLGGEWYTEPEAQDISLMGFQ